MYLDNIDEVEAVKVAAAIEDNGFEFYTLLAGAIKDASTAEALKKLAQDEKKHKAVIEKSFFPKAGLTDQITPEEADLEKRIKGEHRGDIFTKRIDVKALLKVLDTPEKALILALDTERFSVSFFERLALKADSESSRAIYASFAEEERSHVRLIEELLGKARQS